MDWSHAADILGALAAAVALLGAAIVVVRFIFRPRRKVPPPWKSPYTPDHPPVDNKR